MRGEPSLYSRAKGDYVRLEVLLYNVRVTLGSKRLSEVNNNTNIFISFHVKVKVCCGIVLCWNCLTNFYPHKTGISEGLKRERGNGQHEKIGCIAYIFSQSISLTQYLVLSVRLSVCLFQIAS